MNPINRTIAALSSVLMAASTSVLPAKATIDSGTGDMLRTAESYGLTVQGNHPECTSTIHGWYVHETKTVVICRLSNIGAEEHDTARHEVFHFIQGCQTTKSYLEPLIKNKVNFVSFVERSLTPGQIDNVKMTYPKHKWATELEAFAAARALSSNTIRLYIQKYCG